MGRITIRDSLERIHAAADENLVTHMSWIQGQTTGMRVVSDEQLTVIDSGIADDTFNFVCRARMTAADLPARVTRVIEYFQHAKRPYSWWVGPSDQPPELGELLQQAGFHPAESELAMIADLEALTPIELAPGGLRIERVRSATELRTLTRLLASNWKPPSKSVEAFYAAAEPCVLREDARLWFYLGYIGSEPVATAELTLSDAVVGLYNISTLEPYRRQGIGAAMTFRPLLDALAVGYRTAVLQAAPAGVNVYARLGFREMGRYTEYHPASQKLT